MCAFFAGVEANHRTALTFQPVESGEHDGSSDAFAPEVGRHIDAIDAGGCFAANIAVVIVDHRKDCNSNHPLIGLSVNDPGEAVRMALTEVGAKSVAPSGVIFIPVVTHFDGHFVAKLGCMVQFIERGWIDLDSFQLSRHDGTLLLVGHLF